MRNATKFTFDTNFSASDAARARQHRALSDVEIESLCAEARAEGMRAAEVRALESVAGGARDAADAVREALAHATREIECVRAEAARIAFSLARKVAGAAVAAFPAGEVEAALRQAMHQAIGEPRIALHARPEIVDALSGRIAEIAQHEGYDGRIQISADPTLEGADCRIEWRGGGAERASVAIEIALDELIARRFAAGAEKNGE